MALRPQSCNVLNLVPNQIALLLVFLSWFMCIGIGYPPQYTQWNNVFYSFQMQILFPDLCHGQYNYTNFKKKLKWKPEKLKWQFLSQTVFSSWPWSSVGRPTWASALGQGLRSSQPAISELPSVDLELNA